MNSVSLARALVEYNPLDPATLANPYRAYAELRATPGMYWHEGMSSYVASRYNTCKYVLSTNALFAKDRGRIGVDAPDAKRSVQTEDPPSRLGLRQEFRHELHQTDLTELCRVVGDRFDERLRSAGDNFDFVSEVAYPTALDLTATVIGLSAEQARDYMTTHRALQRATDGGLDPDRLEGGRRAGARLHKYAAEWLEQDGVEGLLAPARAFAAKYPPAYAINTLAGMVNASFSTAGSFTAGVFNVMVKDPGLVAQAREALTNGHGFRAVSEFLRYLAPAQATSRVVVKACTVDGVSLRRGDTVVTLMASANRDPDQFDNPDELNLFRPQNRHLSFAAGPHMCLGKKLAEEWGQELIRRLTATEVLSTYRAGAPEFLDSATVRSIVSLPTKRA